MSFPSLFEICVPREDVLQGTITESDFAADLAQVLRGEAPVEYLDPVRFFAFTHPTRGLKDLLLNVCLRLSGRAGQTASIFRLDTNYGGGKTHALIALAHVVRDAARITNIREFVKADVLPKGRVRIAAFDGENGDPINGRPLGDGIATDAYSDENRFIADKMEEAESVSARKATLLDPTEEDETVKVLRRRLFTEIDDAKAAQVIAAYQRLWDNNREYLPSFGAVDRRVEIFGNGFPLHPELIDTLKEKTSTLSNFQRVRGMLRLLARTVAYLWAKRPKDAHAIHLHHIDPAFEPLRQEITTRLNQRQLVPAIKADVAAVAGDQPALAQELDSLHYHGLPPYGSYVARTILFHTLAFNETLKGVPIDHLRYAILSPGTDISFVDDAVRRFVQTSAYLDDRPNAPLRFLTEANLTQVIRRQEQQVDPDEARAQLNDQIRTIFGGTTFNLVPFPGGPYEVPDDIGDGKPYLVLIGYDAADITADSVVLPESAWPCTANIRAGC